MNTLFQGRLGAPITHRHRTARAAAVALIAGALVGVITTTAVAASQTSTTGYYTVASRQNRNWAKIDYNTNPIATAYTYTGPNSPTTAPVGYVGSRDRLFLDNGQMSCEGTNTYNTQSITKTTMWIGRSCDRFTHNTWYSYGVSYSWNGNGYSPWYSYRTVSVTS